MFHVEHLSAAALHPDLPKQGTLIGDERSDGGSSQSLEVGAEPATTVVGVNRPPLSAALFHVEHAQRV